MYICQTLRTLKIDTTEISLMVGSKMIWEKEKRAVISANTY